MSDYGLWDLIRTVAASQCAGEMSEPDEQEADLEEVWAALWELMERHVKREWESNRRRILQGPPVLDMEDVAVLRTVTRDAGWSARQSVIIDRADHDPDHGGGPPDAA